MAMRRWIMPKVLDKILGWMEVKGDGVRLAG